MAKEAQALKPIYAVDSVVSYTDRHGRSQVGKVIDIEGRWTFRGSIYLIYRVQHPTYQHGYFYCGEEELKDGSHE